MAYNISAVRELLMVAFSDEELDTFCYDHARPIKEQFTTGQSKGSRVQLLVEYAERYGLLPTILTAVQDANPYQFAAFAPRLNSAPSNHKAAEPTAVQKLPLPLQKYDPFFEVFVRELTRWDGNASGFARCVLASLATAINADLAFVLRIDGGTLTPTITLDDRAGREAQKLFGNSRVRELLFQALQYSEASYVSSLSDVEPTLFMPLGKTPPELLVFSGVRSPIMLDSAISIVLEAILTTTKNLTVPVSTEVIELKIYNALRKRIGYVSDAMYNRQYAVFVNRLEKMTVFFEPIVYLHPSQPYIWGWEALARDPETLRAPVDLFGIAELWGRRFQLQLDMHFLRASVARYIELPAQPSDEPGVRSREEILPLAVNVYPESIIRTRYYETLQELYDDGKMPLNKLTLEISEKSELPKPEEPKGQYDVMQWFRQYLLRIEQLDVRFAIDDFGVGYASSSRLSRLGAACIKIDRDALLDKFGEITFDYVLDFAHSVPGQIQVIVEGVDYDSRFPLRALYDRNIRYVQGHSLGVARPTIDRLSAEDRERICEALRTTSSQRTRL